MERGGVGMGREIEGALKKNFSERKEGERKREKKKGGWLSVKIKKKSPSAREKKKGRGGVE